MTTRVPAEGWKTSEAVTGQEWKTGTGSFGAKNGVIETLARIYTGYTARSVTYPERLDDIPVFISAQHLTRRTRNGTEITGSVVYDDAAVVYINGTKIAGFDDGSFDEFGYGGSNASTPKTGEIQYRDIEALGLKATGNVVSVELHNGRPSSSDIYFDFTELVLHTGEPAVQTRRGKRAFTGDRRGRDTEKCGMALVHLLKKLICRWQSARRIIRTGRNSGRNSCGI